MSRGPEDGATIGVLLLPSFWDTYEDTPPDSTNTVATAYTATTAITALLLTAFLRAQATVERERRQEKPSGLSRDRVS